MGNIKNPVHSVDIDDDYALVYNVNNVDDCDLFNTLSLRDGWKKCMPFLENSCTDFKH